MPSPDRFSANSTGRDAHRDRNEQELPNTQPIPELQSPEQLDRIADLVACGELPLPIDLCADQLELLASGIQKRRRRRLVKFIARAIAMDIHQSRQP